MSSTFGKIFSVTTWGESHGPAVGAVLDGCPAGLPITEEMIQAELNRRRPGQGKLTTPRNEKDTVKILSGVFEGKTTGTPISFVVFNEDQHSKDYADIAKWYRPGHADLCYDLKYGFRDYRGGGRSSARETIGRVAAGAVAKAFLKTVAGTEFLSWVSSVGTVDGAMPNLNTLTLDQIEASPVRCPDETASSKMEQAILEAKSKGDSIGGTVALFVKNVPAALGEPVFDRLDALLAQAMLSIPRRCFPSLHARVLKLAVALPQHACTAASTTMKFMLKAIPTTRVQTTRVVALAASPTGNQSTAAWPSSRPLQFRSCRRPPAAVTRMVNLPPREGTILVLPSALP